MSNGKLYTLDHCTYQCQYHLVWIPKYRSKTMSDKYIKAEFQRIFKQIAKWKQWHILAWHIGDEHIHLYISIPPKYSIAYVIQILKSKSSAWIKKKTNKIPKGSFWVRGYYVSTVGANEEIIRNYIKNQHYHHIDTPSLF
jgi:putative transposase